MHHFFQRHPRWYLYLLLFAILCGMFFLPKVAAAGALKGLMLWFETLLPVLLPFLMVSGLLIRLNMTRPVNQLLSPLLCRILPISEQACYPLLLGLLCGMPLGAKTTATLYERRSISPADAAFLLAFANNASLMFIVSYVIENRLRQPAHTLSFLTIIYISALLSALLLPYHNKAVPSNTANDKNTTSVSATEVSSQYTSFTKNFRQPSTDIIQVQPVTPPTFTQAIDDSITDSLQTITKIGGYIILFSMLSGFLVHSTLLPEVIRATAAGILEITGGIQLICESTLPATQKTALTLAITSFGGISGLMQTRSVTLRSGLSIKHYFFQKCTQAIITYLLTLLLFQLWS